MVAPAYVADSYVDHVLSANLDSTFAFEGPEKLLEIWFWPSAKAVPTEEGLRAIPLEKWVRILDLVSCKILSMKLSPSVDAYLLSESSLFVFPHKMILKTCGTTTTLACLDEVFKTASQYLGEPMLSKEIYKVFYSRRSFMFPDKQRHVHTDWRREVELLNEHFVAGKSYVVGDFTSDDHWYLYMGGSGHSSVSQNDQTFEILMTQLDAEKAKAFVTSREPGQDAIAEDHDLGHDSGMDTMRATGLDSIFAKKNECEILRVRTPQEDTYMPSPLWSDTMEYSDDDEKPRLAILFIHDAFSFTPCGYSSNSVSSLPGGYYYTLHITPESGWSYASFETNYPFSATSTVSVVDVLLRVLAVFLPGRFSVTLINEASDKTDSHDSLAELARCDQVLAKLGYAKQERVIHDLKNEYNLLYLNFVKNASV